MVQTFSTGRSGSSHAPGCLPTSPADRGSGSTTPANGRRDRCGSGSPMTHTSPVADPVAGSAAAAGSIRALEFDAIVERLAGHTSFEPARELALAIVPVA